MASCSLVLLGFLSIWLSADGRTVQEEPLTVHIDQGALRGTFNYTADGTKYYKFLRIPYAKPPLGNLRFAAPQDPDCWRGVRDATYFGPACSQKELADSSEDCLFVNIFTPQVPSCGTEQCLLPVLVYIFAGAFTHGTPNIDPGHILDEGIMLVTMGCRLNVFGFLGLNGTDAPGNAGLKDQSAALRWIQKNIAKFGGDPDNVTIYGTSSGGACVEYHILSPMSKGLFNRAISGSGSALNPWSFVKNTEDRVYRLGAILGKNTTCALELLEYLRSLPAEDLAGGISQVLTSEETRRLYEIPFAPSLEFPGQKEKAFLLNEPSYIVDNGIFNKVPYITGVTKREFGYFLPFLESVTWEDINNNLEMLLPEDLGLVKGSEKTLEVGRKVKKFYFGDKMISDETSEQFIDLQTDLLFDLSRERTIHVYVEKWNCTVYSYQFVYGRATHSLEMPYVIYRGKVQGETSDNARLARLLAGIWASFVKTGHPSLEGEVTWKPVTKDSFSYLEIDLSLSLKKDLEKERMDFWFDIYKEYSNSTTTFQQE